MVNTEDFIKRLEIILDYYNLNASSFADKIGVQRSSLSHLLSGRNKPSLDFILKIMEVFPEVDLYWILNGKGTFPKTAEAISPPEKHSFKAITPQRSVAPADNLFSELADSEPTPALDQKKEKSAPLPNDSNANEVEKIVFFYKNGTFKEYIPN